MKLKLRKLNVILTALLFAIYSVYNIFIIYKGGASLSSQAILIRVVVALMYLVLTAFAVTAGVKTKSIRFGTLAEAFEGNREDMLQDVRSVIDKLRAIGAIDE